MPGREENNSPEKQTEYQPLVSIVTPVLNGMKYLEICLQTVLQQSYPRIEHILIDGGSTDGTLDMIADYQRRFPDRIRFISEPDNGIGEAVGKGLKLAKGDILGWIDTDDMYVPDAIRTIVDFFAASPDAYFVFGDCYRMNEIGEVVNKHPVKDFNLKEAVRDRHFVVFCASFYRREVIERVGTFNTLGNDLDFWLRVNKEFRLYRIEKTLSHFRRHPGSISLSNSVRAREMDRTRFREDYLLCRQYGGGILAPRCRRYFAFTVLDKLGVYCFVNRAILPRLRRYPLLNQVLRIFGA